MKIGHFYDRKTTQECSEDKTAVSNAVKTESELVYEHKVCHKTVRGLSSLKTSSCRMVSRYVIALAIYFNYCSMESSEFISIFSCHMSNIFLPHLF